MRFWEHIGKSIYVMVSQDLKVNECPHVQQKLNALSARRMTKPGRNADGSGLYLHRANSEAMSWILRVTMKGKARTIGLGSALDMTHLHITHPQMDHLQGPGFFGLPIHPETDMHIWGPASSTLSLDAWLARYLSPRFQASKGLEGAVFFPLT